MRIHLMAAAMAGRRNKAALSPGPKELIFGDNVNGYFGTLTEAELISAYALSDIVGMNSAGTFQGAGTVWLKFAVNTRIIYVASKAIRYAATYNQLNALGLIDQSKELFIGTNKFKLGLLTGSANETGTALGGEWLATIAKVVTGGAWASFTPSELGFTGSGLYSFVRDSLTVPTVAVCGGSTGLGITTVSKTVSHSNYGWRPMLEWMSPDDLPYEPDDIYFGAPYLGSPYGFSGVVSDQFYTPKDISYSVDGMATPFDLSGIVVDQFQLNKEVTYSAEDLLPVYDIGYSFQ